MPRPKSHDGAEDSEDEVPWEEPSIDGSRRSGLGNTLEAGAAFGARTAAGEDLRGMHGSMHASASSRSLDSASDVFQSTPCFSDTASSLGFSCGQAAPEIASACLPPIPDSFRCPITCQIMEDPVTLNDGRTYERSSVSSLGYEGVLIPNEPLKEAMQAYFELQREIERQQGVWLNHVARQERRVSKTLLYRRKQVHGLQEALHHSRRRVQELSDHRKLTSAPSAVSTSASLEEVSNNTSTGTPSGSDRSVGEEKTAFRSGPAPRSGEAAAAPRRRPSVWSHFLPGALSRRGGA